MPQLDSQELVIGFVLVLLVFCGRKLPGLGRGLGEGIKEFRRAGEEFDRATRARDHVRPLTGMTLKELLLYVAVACLTWLTLSLAWSS